jgi:exonuclease III
MKIVSWNCRGKFREKYPCLKEFNADIYVVQECEDPNEYSQIAEEFCSNYFWCGENKSKGLGIFVNPNLKAKQNNWETYCLRNFISVRINDDFDLIGVWACKPYIEEYYIYQSINISKYNEKTVIIGDFNSNTIWDKDHGKRNHSEVIKELDLLGLISAYHYVTGEKNGQETKKTFHLYKHLDKSYHIDHCFVNKDRICHYTIGNVDKWLKHSDHMPIEIELKY